MFSRFEYWRWRRRRRRRRAILLLVAVIAASAAYAHHDSQGDRDHRADTTVSYPRSSATRPVRRVRAARRVRPAARANSSGQATAGTGLDWASFHGIELPYSPQDGPRHVRGGLAWGFSDTPRGALIAAVNIGVRTAAQWGPAIFVPTVDHQVTGPDAAALLKADLHDYAALRAAAHLRPGQPAGRGYAAEAGYRFVAFAPVGAAVEIATEGPGTSGGTVLVVTRVDLVWRRGDWRVIAPPGGDWANAAFPISSLTGYSIFAAQG
jgi:hypothetical protein